jgi:hypothetical protein
MKLKKVSANPAVAKQLGSRTYRTGPNLKVFLRNERRELDGADRFTCEEFGVGTETEGF